VPAPEPILLVKIGPGLLGVPLRYVREITADATTFPVPIQLPDVSHVAMVRSVPHAVLNSEYYFRIAHEPKSKLLILIHQMALFIDEALQTVHPADLQVIDETDLLAQTRFVEAVMEFRNRVIPIANIPEIIRDEPEAHFLSV